MKRICQLCGKEFKGNHAVSICRSCYESTVGPVVKQVTCPICGKLFVPRSKAGACSKTCALELSAAKREEYRKTHQERINQRAVELRKQKLDAMSPEERRAYRDRTNALNRDYYAKRIESMSPDELLAFRIKNRELAKAYYKKHKSEQTPNKKD